MNNYSEHRIAARKAARIGEQAANQLHYRLMRNPLTAAGYGVRAWPEALTPENVASWIVSNVSYSTPCDAHSILAAMVFENNA